MCMHASVLKGRRRGGGGGGGYGRACPSHGRSGPLFYFYMYYENEYTFDSDTSIILTHQV